MVYLVVGKTKIVSALPCTCSPSIFNPSCFSVPSCCYTADNLSTWYKYAAWNCLRLTATVILFLSSPTSVARLSVQASWTEQNGRCSLVAHKLTNVVKSCLHWPETNLQDNKYLTKFLQNQLSARNSLISFVSRWIYYLWLNYSNKTYTGW